MKADPAQLPGLVAGFCALMVPPADEHCRAFAPVLLRRMLNEEFIRALPQPAMQTLRSSLLAVLQSEQIPHVRNKVCDTVSELAIYLIPESSWPELLPQMFQWSHSADALHKESALKIFAQLSKYLTNQMKPHATLLRELFFNALQDPNSKVRLAGLLACTSFISAVETPQERNFFQGLLPGMLQCITFALSHSQQDAAVAIQNFIEIAEEEPLFLRPQFPLLIDILLAMVTNTQLEDHVRHLPIELLLVIAENAPPMCRKNKTLLPRLLPLCMQMLLSVDDDLTEWNAQTQEDDNVDGDISDYDVGLEALDRISLALGGKAVLAIIYPIVQQYVASPDWKQRNAAVMAISVIGEGCHKQFVSQLETVVRIVLDRFGDQHPRVRWACCNCVGQMSQDFAPEFQQSFHAQVLPQLIACMGDSANPRIQTHACASMINFAELLNDPDVIRPYLATLLPTLAHLLQNSPRAVQEQAITAIASTSDAAQQHFLPWYDHVMPMLKQVFVASASLGPDYRMLRGKAMECMSLVSITVGKEKFLPDAPAILDAMMQQQNTPMEPDDPQISYMVQAWTRFCKCLGSHFVPYLAVALPPVLEAAQIQPELQIADLDDATVDFTGFDTVLMGDKKVGIRTSMLDEKATACHMLGCYLDELKEGFYPYVPQVSQILIPLLKFYYHEDTRQAAVESMPDLLIATKAAVEKTLTSPNDLALMANAIFPPFCEALVCEPERGIVQDMLVSIRECIELVDQAHMTPEQIQTIVAALQTLMNDTSVRDEERTKRRADEDFDEEEREALAEDKELDEDLLSLIAEVFGVLAKTKSDLFFPIFESLLPGLLSMARVDGDPHERQTALCILDDIVESGPAAAPYHARIFPVFLASIEDQHAGVRQAAVYGCGAMAQFAPALFAPTAMQVVQRMVALVQNPQARSTLGNQCATDNTISAIGKICLNQGAAISALPQLIQVWVDGLPIKGDRMEARVVYAQLCTFLESGNAAVLGPNFSNMTKVVIALADALILREDEDAEADDNDADDAELVALKSRVKRLLVQMRSTVPAATLQAIWPQIPTEYHGPLTRAMQ
eukprot:TRINITY_DN10783_c0_g1_i1.p1 TRINITY_DN10783_c0_g1~~TRINITY_DN10783_c0_g1_i1.p1  ORF type:complete len:1103 (-),score=294.98 TRINITY_DN10783_c0_g1_i1:27-3248(-)